ncbi:cytochrome P450 [Lentinula edodes]|uniref:cytochrome P450 n=1 Tax=Lentinula edodes TaxID=5353 RepID=UPI001E8EDBCA|nr:cytochrome P450 [Lentinula edodes]KAH7875268.1 cytochrome P450 [Lentinula edodes]
MSEISAQLICSALGLGALLLYALYLPLVLLYKQYNSSFRDLPGPPSTSWLKGNFPEMQESENTIFYKKWANEYGPTMQFKVFFNMSRLYTADTKALNHILHNEYIYHKPRITQWSLGRLTGPGLFYVQGDKHKFQRKIISPAFSPGQLRGFSETFFEKAEELRDIWASQIEVDGNVTQVDALSWLSKMTLDVIGRTGFHYDFHALSPEGNANELNKALSIGFHAATRFSIWLMIQSVLPVTRWMPSSGSAQLRKAKKTMDRIGQELLQESKAQLMTSGRKLDTWRSKDLLSLLVRSNMNADIPYRQRMSDEDVLAQVPTFVFAGHDTISSGTAWSLYALSLHDSVQDSLRKELLRVPTERPTMEDLNSLPYLDAVVKETLRFHSPAPETARVAVKDDILPLNTPVTDKNGIVHREICIKKGQHLLLAISGVNLAKEIWGEDAMDFKPERWLSKLPETVNSIPGVWGNMMTFLGGPHGCIGYRYTVLEMKVLLFTLVRAFEIKLALPKENIINRTSIVQRPYIKGEIEVGGQLPLLISHALKKE